MKINFVTTIFDGKTGGLIYDGKLASLMKNKINNINVYDDAYYGNEFEEIEVNYKRFEKIYNNHADEIVDCDYLIINSRLYTRFISFPWKKTNHKCRIILIHHHFNFLTQTKFINRVVHKKLELDFLKKANIILTPNLYTVDTLKKFGFKDNVYLLEAYIDNTIHATKRKKKDQIIFVGSVIERKGLVYGINAFFKFYESHPTYQFLIVGTFDSKLPYSKKLIEMIKDKGLSDKVKFIGRVDEAEKNKLMNESKLFLFPSQNEGYGLVIVEAMSYGLPVVAFDNTAMPYTVNNHNGALIQNKQTDLMAKAISDILDHKSKYEELSMGALNTVRNLPSQESINEEYKKFLEMIERKEL